MRMMSMGARIRPASPAALTAMAMLAKGLGLSRMFILPGRAGDARDSSDASGRSSMADSKLLVHVSIVFSSTL